MAATTRVGTLLGARKPARARLSYILALFSCVFFELLLAAVLILGARPIGKLFCNDADVIAYYVQLMPIVSLVMLVDGAQIAGSGALRGLGRQRLGMVCNFISFYIIGIPLGYVMAFLLKFGMFGIWLGLCTCDAVSAVFFTIVLFCTNWGKAALEIATEAEAVKIAKNEKQIQADIAAGIRAEGEEPGEETALAPEPPMLVTSFSGRYGTAVVAKAKEAEARKAESSALREAEVMEEADEEPQQGPVSPETVRRRVRDDGDDEEDEDEGEDSGEVGEVPEAGEEPEEEEEGKAGTESKYVTDTESDDSSAKKVAAKKKSIIRLAQPPTPPYDGDQYV